MEINGLIATESGGDVEIVGFSGTDLTCEGCEATTEALFETGDSVMLCKACYDDLQASQGIHEASEQARQGPTMNEAYGEIKRLKLIIEMLRVLYPSKVAEAEEFAKEFFE